ncbi:MAG: transposase [SAR86 cluster bacterium]|uniref:Transposase n=1 Tax=SAR86 cluster bacterium TaxID=2030880 RepID=A0A2A5AYS7_9GAMM|nr:MAG: transposase [SAR86 cluster bacterium]
MTRARYQQVSIQDTPYYHCISRCVRRAYLCGNDPVSGQNFDHRKQWLVTRIKQLSAQFSIDICAYAIMGNHYHLVLFVNQQQMNSWDDAEVIKRWTQLFPRNAALVETLQNNKSTKAAQKLLKKNVDMWRERLMDISWFMRCLNESIARRANREDKCSGRFWEGRFKSQALLDEKALVTCMAYVDLNPVRAGIAESLENSDFTSIQERLIHHARKVKNRSYRQHRLLTRRTAKHLVGRQSKPKQATLRPMTELAGVSKAPLPITSQAYFDLLESTCAALYHSSSSPHSSSNSFDEKHKVLHDLGIGAEAWLKSVSAFHRHYSVAAGGELSLIHFHESRIKAGVNFKHPHKWIRGIHASRLLYGT